LQAAYAIDEHICIIEMLALRIPSITRLFIYSSMTLVERKTRCIIQVMKGENLRVNMFGFN
jgi:hypothetical protein